MRFFSNIKHDYPKAFSKVLEWNENGEMYFFDKIRRGTFVRRDLFDFFDIMNLKIVIAIDFTYNGHEKSTLFYTKIYHDEALIQNPIYGNKKFENRHETEQHAFITAFGILERKL